MAKREDSREHSGDGDSAAIVQAMDIMLVDLFGAICHFDASWSLSKHLPRKGRGTGY